MRLPGFSDFQRIAEGGEGIVYRARQDGLDRFVAVKVINLSDPSRLARFRRELEITVRLGRQHPHIVTVIDTGTTPDGRPCIVMEYYDLGSLQNRLKERGPLPVEDVAAAGVAVADALAFAHAQGFLHRDVKPQNILILPTSYVLGDFGIARMADAGHTTSLQMISYRHAAPQMINGGDPSAADDQWSLGSTLFTLLDGAPPFSSDNPDEDTVLAYLERVRATEPRPMRRSDVPPDLAAIIARCLSKNREDRFPDAAALRSALAAVNTRGSGWAPALPAAVDPQPTTNIGRHPTTNIGPRQVANSGPLPVANSGPPTTHSRPQPVADPGPPTTNFGPQPPVDFGPRPTPPPSEPLPTPQPSTVDRDLTVAGPNSDLAGLTVRLSDKTGLPDFGPAPGNYSPTSYPPAEPPVVAVLPTPIPWRQDQDPTTTITPLKPRGNGRRKLLIAAAAVLVGTAAGVLVPTLLNRSDNQAVPPPTTSRRTAPTTTTTIEPSTPSPAPSPETGGDAAFAPTLNPVEDQGDSVILTWSDPTNGNAQFVVLDVTNTERKALVTVAPGTTTYTVENLDPTAGQYCFQIIGIGLDDPTAQHGASVSVCTNR
jgi:serine/threonine protein kinase